jgi:hypothetical protein
MAHFAELNIDNVVLRVITIHNNEIMDNGVESENKGVKFCESLFGGVWKQTSYNATIRKNYAGIGFVYDLARDAFIPPQPFSSWVLDENTCRWIAPVAYPTDGMEYYWDEFTLSWVLNG